MTLTEFLLARIAEDEAMVGANPMLSSGPRSTKRVLAECEAKRAIVERYLDTHSAPGDNEYTQEEFGLETAAAILASIYVDHPDYREEWGA